MATERIIPGSGFINETGTRQVLVPGGAYANETVSVSGISSITASGSDQAGGSAVLSAQVALHWLAAMHP